VRRAPTSYKTTPEPPTGHNTVAAAPQGIVSRSIIPLWQEEEG